MSRRSVIVVGAALPAAACAPGLDLSPGSQQRELTFERGGEQIQAFVALPKKSTSSIVAVFHGNGRIPVEVRETALWAASLGYVGFAVNPTSREPDETRIPRAVLLGSQYGQRYLDDTRAGIARLRADKLVGDGKVAAFGYCGGGYVGLMWGSSAQAGELGAIVGAHVATRPLRSSAEVYTRPDGIELYRRTHVPVQFHQGGADEYTPQQDIAELKEVAKDTGKLLELYVYPNASHGFAMDVTRADAKLVRARAATFLQRHLR